MTILALFACASVAIQDAPVAAEPPPIAVEETDTVVAPPERDVRRPTDYRADRALGPTARQALSAARKPTVAALFDAAGMTFPPSSALVRVYKAEGEVEVWASSGGPLALIATWQVCYASGDLGPKRREGDLQVPEGFYTIDLFNPSSLYHLSMRVSYPNRSDRILGDPKRPGGDIMIHGDCVSIGCVSMSDERIEELWQIAIAMKNQGKSTAVHALPARDLETLISSGMYPQHEAFWRNLAEGDAIFRRELRAPTVSVADDGRYVFR